jgi:hypothetical protein
MQFNRKTLLVLFSGILLVFSAKSSLAQYQGMAAFNAQQSKQFINQQMQNQMQMMNNNNWGDWASQGTKYQVTFKDSSVKEVVSFLYADTLSHKNFLLFVNKKVPKSDSTHRYQKIYSDQTLYISTITDYDSPQETFGVPTDSCWMFKVVSGPVNVYSKYPVLYDDLYPGSTIAIQVGDEGPMVKYNEANLRQMIGQDYYAAALIDKKKYYKAVIKYNADITKAAKK